MKAPDGQVITADGKVQKERKLETFLAQQQINRADPANWPVSDIQLLMILGTWLENHRNAFVENNVLTCICGECAFCVGSLFADELQSELTG